MPHETSTYAIARRCGIDFALASAIFPDPEYRSTVMKTLRYPLILAALALSACSSTYYDAMEQVGYHKRDILVDRVESARDAQTEAQQQFKSALDQFASVIQLENSDLKRSYEELNTEFEASETAAEEVTERIDKVEAVADALFEEWQEELDLYQNQNLRSASAAKLTETKRRYVGMLKSMRQAEQSMQPVLISFRDNVLFLKHNLNAQAIGSLQGEFTSLKSDIQRLVTRMNESIEESNRFIQSMQSG